MSACRNCGDDPVAELPLVWSVFLSGKVPSLNARKQNGRYGFGYRRTRNLWLDGLLHRMERDAPAEAAGRRYVILTRVIGPRQRKYDYDNLVGGLKGLLDTLVSVGLLTGDDEAGVLVEYRQERGKGEGMEIEIREGCP